MGNRNGSYFSIWLMPICVFTLPEVSHSSKTKKVECK